MTGYLGVYAQRTKHLFDYDVVNPKIELIDGRPYRVNPSWPSTYEDKSEGDKLHSEYDGGCPGGNQPYEEDDGGLSEDEDLDTYLGKDGQYKYNCHVPKSFYPFIIGVKGSTKRRIESETNTTLSIPRQGQTGDIVISSYSEKNIASAKRRLDLLLVFARKKIPYTHLLSIPMNVPNLQERFAKFKDLVLSDFSHCRGVEEALFQEPGRLHITMGMLMLADSVERDEAVEALQRCGNDVILPILRSQRIKIKLKGLEIMNDDPAEVDILYAKVVDESGLVQKLCDDVVQYFIRLHLISKAYQKYDTVKLHVTLMNTKYRIRHQATNDPGSEKRTTFNAKEILDSLGDFDFGETFVYCVHLSQRHTSDIDGYFKSSGVISL
uniref:Activating signal cointegrator 1 complex subunit 1 n=1 Tax=Cacopsylla melanoneura TaxID=428564 RepID=A0A8D8XG39_9HEMI